jgi:hypothetical protein
MKKYHQSCVTRRAPLIIIIILVVFAAAGTGYAQNDDKKPKNNAGALYAEPASTTTSSKNSDNNGGALYRSDNPLDERPGNGGGIGQDPDDIPISDGLLILLGFSLIYGIIKFSTHNFNFIFSKENRL